MSPGWRLAAPGSSLPSLRDEDPRHAGPQSQDIPGKSRESTSRRRGGTAPAFPHRPFPEAAFLSRSMNARVPIPAQPIQVLARGTVSWLLRRGWMALLLTGSSGYRGLTHAQETLGAADASPPGLPPVVPLRYPNVFVPAENDEFEIADNWIRAPRGPQVCGGVQFEIDGLIQLRSRTSLERKRDFREHVTLAVPTNTYGSVHLLAATSWASEANRQVAEIVWRYTDGSVQRTPILYTGNLRRLWRVPFEEPHHVHSRFSRCVILWQSIASLKEGSALRMYRATFPNPEPTRQVAFLQLQSSIESASLVVLGVSMDPLAAGPRPDSTPDLEPEDPKWTSHLGVAVLAPETGKAIGGTAVSAEVRTANIVGERVHTADRRGVADVLTPTGAVDSVTLIARAKGYADTLVHLIVNATNPLPASVKIRLLEGTDLGGRITDAAGRPISGVNVEVYWFWIGDDPPHDGPEEPAFARTTVQTGADGRWQVEAVPVRNLLRVGVRFRHSDHVEDKVYSIAENPTMESELREKRHQKQLVGAAKVVGIVVDPNGQPVADARIRVGVRNSGWSHQASSDGSGRFTVESLAAGRTLFAFNSAGFSPLAKEITVNPRSQKIQFPLEQGSLFRGRVVDPDNQPIRCPGRAVHPKTGQGTPGQASSHLAHS